MAEDAVVSGATMEDFASDRTPALSVVQSILDRNVGGIDDGHVMQCIRIEPLSGGLIGAVYRVTLKLAATSPASVQAVLPSQLILKLAPTSSLFQDLRSHARECNFFQHHADTLARVPRCYAALTSHQVYPCGLLLLEDLTLSGYRLADFDAGLNKIQLEAAVRCLARFHASTWNYGAVAASGNQANAKDDTLPIRKASDWIFACEQFESTWPSLCEALSASCSADTLQTSGFSSTVHALCRKLDTLPPCLCHGDLWANNVMFRDSSSSDSSNSAANPSAPSAKEDGKVAASTQTGVSAAFIDFQWVCIGNPLDDLAFLLLSSANYDVRRECEKTLLHVYRAELISVLPAAQHDSVPQLDHLQQQYEVCKIGALIVMVASSDLFVLNQHTQPRLVQAVQEVATIITAVPKLAECARDCLRAASVRSAQLYS